MCTDLLVFSFVVFGAAAQLRPDPNSLQGLQALQALQGFQMGRQGQQGFGVPGFTGLQGLQGQQGFGSQQYVQGMQGNQGQQGFGGMGMTNEFGSFYPGSNSNSYNNYNNQFGSGTAGSNILGMSLENAIQSGFFGAMQCSFNESFAQCATPTEQRCDMQNAAQTAAQAQSGSFPGCMPSKCQCRTGFLRSYDGSRCVLPTDCIGTLQNCQNIGNIRTCFPGIPCDGRMCPSGWTCLRPKFCLGGGACRLTCVPNGQNSLSANVGNVGFGGVYQRK